MARKKMTQQATDSLELQYSDGNSNKFWKISLDGASHTVNYGRIGTDGQSKTKDFDGEDEARESFEKLVAEKLKKGYVDVAGGDKTPEPAALAEQTEKAAASKSDGAQPAAKPSKAEPAVSTAANLEITRKIDLDPQDWFLAGFRPPRHLKRDEPEPFDEENCLKLLAKLKMSYRRVQWERLKLPAVLSAEEAHFWLVATTADLDIPAKMNDLLKIIGGHKFDGNVTPDAARRMINKFPYQWGWTIADAAVLALFNLFSPEQYIDLVLGGFLWKHADWCLSELFRQLLEGFQKYSLPYLSDSQINAIRRRIRKNWDPHQEAPSSYMRLPEEYYIAAAIGMHDEVYQVTSHWSDDRYQQEEWNDHYQNPQQLVFGLGSAEMVEREWRRLKLRMRTPEHVRAFLACTEFAALDCVADSIIAKTNKQECEALLKTLVLVRAPEAAEQMLRCKLESKMPGIARDWLDQHVGNAVAGLIDTAAGQGKLADAAMEYLRGVKRNGHATLIAACIKNTDKPERMARIQTGVLDHEEKVYDPFDARSTPKWLAEELAAASTLKPKRLPSWAGAAQLPPLVEGERRLNDEQIDLVLQLLAATPVNQRHSLFRKLREHVSRQVRDDFAWKLFQLWGEDGFPSKEKWAMGAIGHLGDDGCALKLTPLIRNWPGESQHARAVFGLECLRALGSKTALMQLSGIAQKIKFKGLQDKARKFVDEIAKERGITRDELEDRVIPDCGLNEDGSREFSFGSRSFSFVLGSDLKAKLRDQNGKVLLNLPTPGVKDDKAAAAASIDEWKLLKKKIKEVATIQAGRLEQSMVTGRRWNVEDFESLLVHHPLMKHLVQKLVWGGFDTQGERRATFRVTEESDYADVEDNSATLNDAAAVGLVHPLELSDAERGRWGELMSDYEIISPFPQLGRAVYALEADEEKTDDLRRFHNLELVAPTLVFTLEKLGWLRGMAMDAGCFDEHSKQFSAADVTAVICYEGMVSMGYIDPNEMLKLISIHFCPGMRQRSGYGWGSEKKLELGNVPDIVISEVLADLQILKSKAK